MRVLDYYWEQMIHLDATILTVHYEYRGERKYHKFTIRPNEEARPLSAFIHDLMSMLEKADNQFVTPFITKRFQEVI